MKKSRVLLTAFAVALSLGSVSVEAKSPMSNFNDKVKEFKKAYKDGSLTRRQKIAAAVAITTAAMALVTGAGVGLEKYGKTVITRPEMGSAARGATLEVLGSKIAAPGRAVGGAIIRGGRAVYGAPGAAKARYIG